MAHSEKRVPARNAVRLSVDLRRAPPTSFDPSRFGEIEITPELRAKFMAVDRARFPGGRAALPSRKRPWIGLMVALALLSFMLAAALVRSSQRDSRTLERPFGNDARGSR